MSANALRSEPSLLTDQAINDAFPRPVDAPWTGRWLKPALLFLSLLAVFKGLHLPDRWGATQMETDYSAGFIKRGLFGELLRSCHINHYNQIVVLSFLFTLILVVELAVIAYQRLSIVAGTPWLGAVMMTSFGLSYLMSLTGHLEIFQAVLAIAVLGIARPRLFLPIAMAASVAGLFVHELFLLVFVPLSVLRALLDALQPGISAPTTAPSSLRRTLVNGRSLGLLALIFIAVATALLLSATPTLSAEKISLLRQSMIARLDFAPREWLFAVFARGIGDNFRFMETLARLPHYWSMQFESLFLFGPVTVFFIAVSLRQVRHWRQSEARSLLRVVAIAASLSPLTLHAQGFDLFRFNALVTLTSFLVMSILLTHPGSGTDTRRLPALPPGWAGAAAFLVALNMGTGVGLLDSQQVRLFPQFESLRDGLRDCRDLLHHKQLSPPHEPWREVKWDPARPKVSSLLCLDNCDQQPAPSQ